MVFRMFLGAFGSSVKFCRGVACLGQFSSSGLGTESKAKVAEKEQSFSFKPGGEGVNLAYLQTGISGVFFLF